MLECGESSKENKSGVRTNMGVKESGGGGEGSCYCGD